MMLFFSLSLISCGQLMGDKTGANDLPELGLKTIGGLEATDVETESYLLKGTASTPPTIGASPTRRARKQTMIPLPAARTKIRLKKTPRNQKPKKPTRRHPAPQNPQIDSK